jgi:cell division protein ZipA
MDELRWILLLVGVLFLIALTAFEMRRARRAPREPFPHFEHESLREAQRGSAEPQLGELPDSLVESAHLDGATAEPIRAQRNGPPLQELPQVSAVHVELFAEASEAAAAPDDAATGEGVYAIAEDPVSADAQVLSEESAHPEAPVALDEPAAGDEPAAPDHGAVGVQGASASSSTGPVVDWPPEGERRILSLRISSSSEQRLSGRAVRQALAACGFVLGRYRIFHLPVEDGRVLLSCASLNKPGNFDPASMDFQRYSGVSVFTVLPGPLPPDETLERLVDAARDLAQRLQAQLLDEHGQPLDAGRVAAMRACLPAPPASAPAPIRGSAARAGSASLAGAAARGLSSAGGGPAA